MGGNDVTRHMFYGLFICLFVHITRQEQLDSIKKEDRTEERKMATFADVQRRETRVPRKTAPFSPIADVNRSLILAAWIPGSAPGNAALRVGLVQALCCTRPRTNRGLCSTGILLYSRCMAKARSDTPDDSHARPCLPSMRLPGHRHIVAHNGIGLVQCSASFKAHASCGYCNIEERG